MLIHGKSLLIYKEKSFSTNNFVTKINMTIINQNPQIMKKNNYVKGAIIVLALLISLSVFSQEYAKNWLIGDFGLMFDLDTVIVRKDYALYESRGMGIISNKYGNLMCYTDGFNIWNRNHTIMSNGQNIIPLTNGAKRHESIIIPKPGSDSEYYAFTVNSHSTQEPSILCYSIIDLELDNGLGAVTVKAKKILDAPTNRLTAVYHNNGYDVWIITHKYNTNSYYAYLLSATGLNETPVVSSVGEILTSQSEIQLKASPDGTKIASSNSNISSEVKFTLFNL